jgi:hypothetical protein
MNIHLPAILGFTRYQGFDPSPYDWDEASIDIHKSQLFCGEQKGAWVLTHNHASGN